MVSMLNIADYPVAVSSLLRRLVEPLPLLASNLKQPAQVVLQAQGRRRGATAPRRGDRNRLTFAPMPMCARTWISQRTPTFRHWSRRQHAVVLC